ncbi:hypothetical protein H206_05135 [Candidatus Electrothrix aarhusensis]|uniref:Uncharacterized protein n=1 Tax=Candidatus Electrothrix aarhusensis TaxID=1859131 RepID=A0A444J5F3_9BACT|nr:hypothetical protein H206_05135 [Candidatus Electrothrix aarhusensis]
MDLQPHHLSGGGPSAQHLVGRSVRLYFYRRGRGGVVYRIREIRGYRGRFVSARYHFFSHCSDSLYGAAHLYGFHP